MISCDDCRKKLVAAFDNEGGKDDANLINAHLKDCPDCRAFQQDMAAIRRQFVSVPIPSLSPSVKQNLLQAAQIDSLRNENLFRNKTINHRPLLLRFPRLTRACGLAGMFLLVVSWFVCFVLNREVVDLRKQLQLAKQEVTLALEKEQLKETQDRQQKAISALYFRMQELENQVDRYSSPRTAFLPAEIYDLSDNQSDF